MKLRLKLNHNKAK